MSKTLKIGTLTCRADALQAVYASQDTFSRFAVWVIVGGQSIRVEDGLNAAKASRLRNKIAKMMEDAG